MNSSDYVQQAIGQRRAEGYCAVLLVSTIIWISTLLQALFENFDPDPLKTLTETKIGLQGMKIDRMFFEKFEDVKDLEPEDFVRDIINAIVSVLRDKTCSL